MRLRPALSLVLSCFVACSASSVALLSGCGSSTVAYLPTNTPTTSITVAISPSTAQTVDAGQTIPLTATVTNDSGSKGVTWSVSAGGGSVSNTTGLTTTYTAPAVQASSVVVTATSVTDPTKTATLAVTVNALPAISTSAPLPVGYPGVAYSATVPAVGGTGARTITLVSGTLPAGLSLSTAGVISGTPTTVGTSTFTLQVRDSAATPVSTTAQLTLTIAAMALNPISLPGAVVGTAYPSAQLSTTGNVGSVTYSIASGALPAGLTLSGAGVISGTPTAAGTSTFTVRAVDSVGQVATLQLSIVTASTIVFNNVTLPPATTNRPIANYQFQASGGTAPYSYALASGSTLPAGLSLTSSGLLTGTPTAANTYTFNVVATDSGAASAGMMQPVRQSATATVTLTVSSVSVTTSSLPSGVVGTAYSASIAASGGTAPYTYAVTTGTLPAGLALNAGTGAITGTPTAAGTSAFTVTVTDSTGATGTANLSITIVSALTFANVTLPSGTVGTAIANYQFAPSGGTTPYTFAVATGSTLPAGLSLSTSGLLSGTPTAAGNYTFGVTATDSGSTPQRATSTVTFNVSAAQSTLTFANVALPAGTTGTAIANYQFAPSGGTSPYTFAVASGSTLPAGLSLSTSGVLSGTPTIAGNYSFGVTATDSSSTPQRATSTVTFNVASSSAIKITPASLPNAIPNSPYSQSLTATGGTSPYTFTLVSGTVPPGLTLESTGVVDGQPTGSTATYTFVVQAKDAAGATGQQQVTLALSTSLSTGANNALLNGRYAFLFTGYNNGSTGTNVYGTAAVGQIVFDGGNGVTGTIDTNSAVTGYNAALSFTGSYRINSDNRGTLVFTVAGASAPTTFVISVQQVANGAASQFRLLEFDSQNPNDPTAVTGSGVGTLQTGTYATAGPTGAYVLSEIGETCSGCNTATADFGPLAQVGNVTFAGTAVVQASAKLDTRLTTNTRTFAPGGTIVAPAGTNGRGTIALTDANGTAFTGQPLNYVYYAVSPSQFYLLSTDAHNGGYALLSGNATLQSGAATLTGSSIAYISGNLPGNGTSNFSRQVGARVQRFTASNTVTTTTVTTAGYQNLNGTPGATTTGTGATVTAGANNTLSFTDTDGTAYTFYMTGPNNGYSLGSGNLRGVVRLEPQTSTTYSAGLYTFASQRTPTNDYGILGSFDTTATSATAGTGTYNAFYVFYDGTVGNRLYRVPTPATLSYTTDATTGFVQVGTTGQDFRGYLTTGTRYVTILDQPAANFPITIFEK